MRISLLVMILLFCHPLLGEAKYIKLADKITSRFCKEVSKPKGLHLCGYGGALMYDVKQLDLYYYSHQCLTLEEARKLYVEVAEIYLSYINEDEKIRPYLHDYPFTMKNLDLMMSFSDKRNKKYDNGNVSLIFYVQKTGKIYYCS